MWTLSSVFLTVQSSLPLVSESRLWGFCPAEVICRFALNSSGSAHFYSWERKLMTSVKDRKSIYNGT